MITNTIYGGNVCLAPAQRAAGDCSSFKVIPDREPAAGENFFQDRSGMGPEWVLNGSGPILNGSGPVRMGSNGYKYVIIII
jgi:hypothetical protein